MYALTAPTPKLKEKLVFFSLSTESTKLEISSSLCSTQNSKKNIVLSAKAKHKNKCHLSYKVGSVLDTTMLYFLNSLTPPVLLKVKFF